VINWLTSETAQLIAVGGFFVVLAYLANKAAPPHISQAKRSAAAVVFNNVPGEVM